MHFYNTDIKNFYFAMAGIKHQQVKEHSERVALIASVTADELEKDSHAAYLAGIFHDIGKVVLPFQLFDGHDITNEEYQQVKEHVEYGYGILGNIMLFTALCAGLHHNVCKGVGYGLTVDMLPKNLSPYTIKKILDISTIISICDFIDAFSTRKTTPKDGSVGKPLIELLYDKFPEDKQTVDKALEIYDRTYTQDSQSA